MEFIAAKMVSTCVCGLVGGWVGSFSFYNAVLERVFIYLFIDFFV
jgi:hypothetical protein